MLLFNLFVLIFMGLITVAQKPQTVYSIVKDLHEISWYEEQMTLWKKEIDKNNQNANAWYNYYMSVRALRNLTSDEERTKYDSMGSQIIEDMYQLLPNSFEANHLMYRKYNDLMDPSAINYLNKAYEIRPDDPRTYVDFMTYCEVHRETAKYSEFCKKHYTANELAAPVLNWAYNILSEVDQNAIILSAGDNDTYPIWTVQEAKNFRKDVKNINTSLILIDSYRNELFKELGVPPLDLDFSKIETMEAYDQAVEKIKAHLIANYTKGPIYVVATAIFQFEKWTSDFYLVGLTYKYCEQPFDNITVIKRNYEHRYLLDHLKETFSYNISNSVSDRMDAIYLPSMVKLYQHYVDSEDKAQQIKLLKLIVSISERTGQQTEISELLQATTPDEGIYEDIRYITMLLNTKDIEKKMHPIKNNLYASENEVTNAEYRAFLSNLKRGRNDELYSLFLYDSSKWTVNLTPGFTDPFASLYHSHPAYDDYPIVNISHQAAEEYCKWLTQQYNVQRKRKFTQVIFRLPTEEEWIALATGDNKGKTGFKNDKVTNDAGCYLVNIDPGNGDLASDGGFFTVKTTSYLPNSNGLYCTLGNVSEMIQKEGIAKGGSWKNTLSESKFDQRQKYDGPNQHTGFRIVMEVIQE